jgi:asparagine synthase (glutamine-hydrolysing)
MRNLDLLAAEAGVMSVHPFLTQGFVSAFSRVGGRKGFGDRATVMKNLFGDLLPDAVLTRRTKARFNRAVFSDHCRAFVAEWEGAGIDADLIDARELLATWKATEPHAMSFALLQECWLASQPRQSGRD